MTCRMNIHIVTRKALAVHERFSRIYTNLYNKHTVRKKRLYFAPGKQPRGDLFELTQSGINLCLEGKLFRIECLERLPCSTHI